MLAGKDPVIIFQFSKLAGTALAAGIARIPLVSQIPTLVDMPPIPIYLSEKLTGLMIDTEDKTVEIDTDVQTKSDGSDPDVNQKGVSSTVSVQITGKKNSVGIILISSMIDLLFDKVSSKEYSITYMHGAITVFRGVLHNFKVSQVADNDKCTLSFDLSRGSKSPQKPADVPVVPGLVGGTPLG